MQQALNFTNAGSPGAVSVGGVLTLKSLSQVQREEKAAAEAANNSPVVRGLVGHLQALWETARRHKELNIEPRLLKALRQRRGEYEPEILRSIKQQGGSEIYMMLTSNKCRAATSWIRDVMTTAADKPWTITPTPIPDLPPEINQMILIQAYQQVQALQEQGMDPSVQQVRNMLLMMRDEADAMLREAASRSAERMERKMQDQLLEGGWVEALSEFIDDVATFPAGILKGPVVRNIPTLQWVEGAGGQFSLEVKKQLKLQWERVNPFMFYPAPDAASIEDGPMIERHQLSRGGLNDLLGVEGYSDAAIRAVLDEYGKGGLRDWLRIDAERSEAEGKGTEAAYTNPSELIDALQVWCSVQGKMLIEWGMSEDDIEDPLAEYNIEAWLIGTWIIKAVVNPDPLGRKPYYKSSYEELPGVFWGNGVPDLCRDAQDVCNSSARALVNNMGIASGPQAWVNIDRLPAGEDVTNLYPWKVWQTTSDQMGNTAPPIDFFQPPSNAAELMLVYDKFSVLADEYTGIPRYMTGDSTGGGAGRTASGMSMMIGNAGKSIKQVIGNMDVKVIQKAVERLYYYNMRYSDDSDLKGDVNIIARGATSLMVKEVAQQRRNEFMQVALQSPAVSDVIGREGIADLLREATRALDMDHELVPPKEVLRQRWMQQDMAMQQQAAMQMAAQGQPGQGNPPAPPGPGQQLQDGTPVTNLLPNA